MSYPPPPPPGDHGAQPGYYAPPPNHPQGTTILVLGILSLVCCGFLGIAAWIMGNTALREIDASGVPYANRGMVQAGRICGIIGVALTVLLIAFYAFLFGIGALTSSDF